MNIVPGKSYNPAVVTPGHRDAFHCAAILCRQSRDSSFAIDPRDRVVIVSDTDCVWFDEDIHSDWDGVADPWADEILDGALFLVFLKPERYTNLRHVFSLQLPEWELPEKPKDDDWLKACKKCES